AASSTMIACAEDGQLTTADASDGGIERSSPYGSDTESSHWEIVDVFGDTVVVKDETDDNDRFQALDRAGEVRAEDRVGAPRAVRPSGAAAVLGRAGLAGGAAWAPPVVRLTPLWPRARGGRGSGAALRRTAPSACLAPPPPPPRR